MKTPPKAAAFTLQELLIVIGVIAVLSILLIPVGMKARDKARAVSCSSNLRQVGAGFHLFIGDNDGRMPTDDSSSSGNVSASFWSQVAPYVDWQPGPDRASVALRSIMHCPNHTESPGSFSYRGNSELLKPEESGGLKHAQINNPTKKILLYEVHVYCEWPIASISASGTGKAPWIPEFANHAHGEFSNFLFADGHVESSGDILNARPTYWEP